MKYLSLLCIALFSFVYSRSQVLNVKQVNAAKQYALTTFDITINAVFKNPYLQEEIMVDMLLKTPSGKQLTLPCYFESGQSAQSSQWKARFTPQETGNYSYEVKLGEQGSGKKGSFNAAKASSNGMLQMRDNWTMQYNNGKPFRGVGENICWESRASDDSKFFKELHQESKYNYEYMLPSLAKNGGNFFRTWICSWNLPIDWHKGFNNVRYQPSDEYFNPSAIKKFDRLVNLCDSLGLHMMLTLGMGAYHQRDGGFATSAANFFVNPQSKQMYRNRLRFIVARWGYSPSIGLWEFFNEVDNVQFGNKDNPIDAERIVKWHTEMADYLRTLDPYHHPITTSISHRDLNGLNSIANIDLNQKHIYKNTKGMAAEIIKYEQQFNKPYVIGEFGYEWDWSKDFNLFADGMDSDFKRGLWYGLFTSTPVLPMSWWWEFFDNRGTDKYIKNVRLISDDMLAAGKGSFTSLKLAANDSLTVMGVNCGKKTYVYVYNPTKNPVTGNIEAPAIKASTFKYYLPETASWSKQTSSNVNRALSNVSLKPDEDLLIVFE